MNKPVVRFSRCSRNSSGYQSRCKECQRKWQVDNPELRKAAQRRYRKRHPHAKSNWHLTPAGRLARMKSMAKHRKIGWSLTLDDILIFDQTPCFYCKCELDAIRLDRIDSGGSYCRGNVVPCCPTCNTVKGVLSRTQLRAHLELMLQQSW